MSDYGIIDKIFNVDASNFETLALEIFQYQYENTFIYKKYVDTLQISPYSIKNITEIPFLPVRFFKTAEIISKNKISQIHFESSGTTGTETSTHFVADVSLYEKSILKSFEYFFGDVTQYCFLALLPSYLEKQHASLVYMAKYLMQLSNHEENAFFLYDTKTLIETIKKVQAQDKKIILLGVTYALLDLVDTFSGTDFSNVIIIETGGMKGRRKEITRMELHQILYDAFSPDLVSSEYGMTELLSQSYSLKNGFFQTPAWKKILVRDLSDPFQISRTGSGAVNIIDFANLYSCSFLAVDDLTKVYEDTSFEILGRIDHSDMRGCNLMV